MNFLTNVEKLLDLPPAKKTQVIRELKSHYYEIETEQKSSGKSPDQIENEIYQRLGSPKDIAARMNAVHNSASWKSAIIAIVPFLGMLTSLFKTNPKNISNISMTIYLIFSLILLAGSVRELVSGRRPIWLATWLAGAYYYGSVIQIIVMMHFHKINYLIISYLIGFIITMTYVYGASRVSRWRTSNILLVIAQTIVYLIYMEIRITSKPFYITSSLHILLINIGAIISIILIVRFALAVFALHDYGSASQSLLFIFAGAIFKIQAVITYIILGKIEITTYNIIGIIAISIAIACYTRMAEWKYKLSVVAISIIPICFLRSLAGSNSIYLFGFRYGIISIAIYYIIFILAYIVPIITYEHFRQKKSREVLDSMISI